MKMTGCGPKIAGMGHLKLRNYGKFDNNNWKKKKKGQGLPLVYEN